jgi:hypothetical protein
MIPGTMSDYDLVYGTQALTKDTQLLELLQKDNPQITLVASPFRVWQGELGSWLSTVRQNLGDLLFYYPERETPEDLLDEVRQYIDNILRFLDGLKLENATLSRNKALESIHYEWSVGETSVYLIIDDNTPGTGLGYSIYYGLPGTRFKYFTVTNKELTFSNGVKISLAQLPPAPTLPTGLLQSNISTT